MTRITPGLYSPAEFLSKFKVGDVLVRKRMGTINVRQVEIKYIYGPQVHCVFTDNNKEASCNIMSYTWRLPGDWP